jgi:hypothetical protein
MVFAVGARARAYLICLKKDSSGNAFNLGNELRTLRRGRRARFLAQIASHPYEVGGAPTRWGFLF